MGVLAARAGARSTRPSAQGQPSPLARAARPVRRLRGVAARVAPGRGAGRRSWRTGGSSWRARPRRWTAHRPAAPRGQTLPRRAAALRGAPVELVAGAARRWRAARGRHAVHGAAGGLPGAAARATAGRTTWWWARPSPAAPARRLEGLIGFFVNTLVLRARPRRPTRRSASCWRGCARPRWAPTRTRTCPSRSWWRSWRPSATELTPLFQVTLALQNAPHEELRLPGCRSSPWRGRGRRCAPTWVALVGAGRRPVGFLGCTTPRCSTPPPSSE